jgi:hypothetical protein
VRATAAVKLLREYIAIRCPTFDNLSTLAKVLGMALNSAEHCELVGVAQMTLERVSSAFQHLILTRTARPASAAQLWEARE